MSNENRQKPLLTDIPAIATIRSEEAVSRTEQMQTLDEIFAYEALSETEVEILPKPLITPIIDAAKRWCGGDREWKAVYDGLRKSVVLRFGEKCTAWSIAIYWPFNEFSAEAIKGAIALAKILWREEHPDMPFQWDNDVHAPLVDVCERELQRWKPKS